MAIQIRRGTNTEWESNNSNIVAGEPAIATDAERFFVGTASGDYAEFANLDIIAPAYDTSVSYVVGDVINRQGKLYSCNTPCSGTFNASYWDEKSLAEILKDLENEIDYAQYEIGYASGELITIDNGASEIPVKDLTLDIDAVQDLHGYDHPWVGGAGKNLLKVTNFSVGQTKSVNDVDFTYNSDGSFTINGTSSKNNNFVNLNYTAGTITIPYGVSANIGFYASSTNSNVILQWSTPTGQPVSLPCSSSGFNISADTTATLGSNNSSWLRIQIPTSGTTVNNLKIYPFWCLSSNKLTQYEPYENICPISGWDEVNVCVAGKNMFDISTFSANDCMYQYASSFTYGIGSATLTKNEDSFTLVRVNTSYAYFICVGKCFANIPVTISFNVTNGYVYDIEARTEPPTQAPNNDKRFYRDTTVGGLSSVVRTFTPAQDGYVYLEIYSTSGNLTNTIANLQYEFGSTKTDYERGSKQTYTIDLDGTRYGGSLDVTTGVLTLTHELFDLGSTNYVYSSNYGGYFYVGLVGKKAGDTNIYADCYANAGVTSVQYMADSTIKGRTADSYIFIKDSRFTDAGDLKTALNGHYAVYELATPTTYQLTPTQVRTLLGANNLWNQMNSNNELAYRISNALN